MNHDLINKMKAALAEMPHCPDLWTGWTGDSVWNKNLEDIPLVFNMTIWRRSHTTCTTAVCLAGLAYALGEPPDHPEMTPAALGWTSHLADMLQISEEEAKSLSGLHFTSGHLRDLTPQQAIEVLNRIQASESVPRTIWDDVWREERADADAD